ncbi:MAG: hypothetical protein ACE5F1_00600, partial [Planctomycetota bacterium]
MRYFLVLALAVGLVYLGMQVFERVSAEGLVRAADGLTPVFERRVRTAETPRREPAGKTARDQGKPAHASFEKASAEKASAEKARGEAWRQALYAGDYEGLAANAGLRATLLRGTAGRLSLEVALALKREDGRHEELLQAADRLVARHPEEAARLTSRSFRVLSRSGKLEAALSAVGSSNRFLRDPDSTGELRAFLARVKKVAGDERKVVILSRCLEKLTRGDPFFSDSEHFAIVRRTYGDLQPVLSRVVFSRNGAWRSKHYRVKPRENFDGIAQKFERELSISLAPGFLQMINGYSDPRRLRVGDMLRIPTAKIRVVVEKGTHVMKLYLDEILIRLYQVGLGRDGRTPEGTFVIEEKQIDPVW